MAWRAYLQEHPRIYGLPTVLALLTIWEILSRSNMINGHLVPPASAVLEVFVLQWTSYEFLRHVVITLFRMASGYVTAVVVAIPLGLLMGYWRRLFDMLELTIEVIRPIPTSALIPVAIIFFGISHTMHSFVVFLASFMPILLSTIDGVRAVDPVLIETSSTLGTPAHRIFPRVIVPAAMPHIVTGLRTSIALALIVAVSSEMIISSEGLGWSVLYAQRTMRVPQIYAGILSLAAVGYLLNRAFLVLEAWMIGWHLRATTKQWA
ncbi:MAG: ABC transporter permease [Deltaproteobacteria bacterium]|nr:ABC transporter permease [Deltaproteobacteria bacterium]